MHEELSLSFPECLREDFAAELPIAQSTVDAIVGSISGADLEALARRSPGLNEYDWANYLRCSVARMVHAAAALRRRGRTGGRLLDFGAYFGNFSLLFARLGYTVDALDAFKAYAPALAGPQAVLSAAGVRLLDFDEAGRELEQVEAGTYDVVLCTGVIEHIPHTPRPLLEALNRVLRPGGELVIDTPNLAHIYNRQKFARGESVLAELPTQYYTERPFEGHHREYTIAELVWMLEQLGHEDVLVEAFNYSMYGQAVVRGRDVINHWAMVKDPTMREYLLSVSRKPLQGVARAKPASVADSHWQAALNDPEQYWQRALPAATPAPVVSAEHEQMIVELQAEVDRRDAEIRQREARLQAEIARRDTLLADQMRAMQAEVQLREDRLAEEHAAHVADVSLRDRILLEYRAERDSAVALRDDIIRELRGHSTAPANAPLLSRWRRLLTWLWR